MAAIPTSTTRCRHDAVACFQSGDAKTEKHYKSCECFVAYNANKDVEAVLVSRLVAVY